jgi:hypothetical protein
MTTLRSADYEKKRTGQQNMTVMKMIYVNASS